MKAYLIHTGLLPALGSIVFVCKVSGKLRQQLDEKRKELADFQSKYKIRIRTEADVAAESQKVTSEGPSKTQGVLA